MTEAPYEGLRRRLAAAQADRDTAVTRARRLQSAGDDLAAAADLFAGAEHTAGWSDHHRRLHAAITAWRAL